jgi:hypothetical protein
MIVSFDENNMQQEKEINIKLIPKLWIYNVEGIHEFRTHKTSIQFMILS